ncbi:DUF1028 domain-containing protein [Roseomonas sp. OT10]|uniref:DUF1028 domain-containing protein n=1 Tax=Roseomonas cutis TaxID=2897332 RepID=UPI001E4627FF|nr:DUF1028 domain-containing protein [Roseomonas sp. OT10]UFN47071.1 DUF1028 domain-containing protein [Roseomonas sp. OT10]
MTWSIVARDPQSGAFAVAVTTCSFAVGASCPHLRSGVGAVSTQSFTNRYLGPAVLDGMERGLPPAAAIEGALAGDAGRHLRQIHAIDRHGRTAAWTGESCIEVAGAREGRDASFAGNMLAGAAVLRDTVAAYAARDSEPLPERLLSALDAGEAAGGDRRGRQSAALVMVGAEDFPDLDIRVDDHPEPLVELRRLLTIWRRDRAPYLDRAPRKADPSGFIDMGAMEAGWRERGLDLRFPRLVRD